MGDNLIIADPENNPHIKFVQNPENQPTDPSVIIFFPIKYHNENPQLVKGVKDALDSYEASLRVSDSPAAKKAAYLKLFRDVNWFLRANKITEINFWHSRIKDEAVSLRKDEIVIARSRSKSNSFEFARVS